jgi:hypothetical protein
MNPRAAEWSNRVHSTSKDAIQAIKRTAADISPG